MDEDPDCPKLSPMSHPLTGDPEETGHQKNQQEDLQGEEGDSGGDQTPRYEPDSPGWSPTSHSVSDAEEGQKNHQGKGKTSNEGKEREVTRKRTKRNGRESSPPEESPDKHEKGFRRDVGDFLTSSIVQSVKTSWLYKKLFGEEDGGSNTGNQLPSPCHTDPPGDVPPQDGQKSKHLKGIFYDMDGDASWLIDQLKDESIPGYDFITCHTLEELKAEECSLVILCLSHESRYEGNVKEFLGKCCKPVIAIITGLENSSSEKEKREYWENVSKDFISSKFYPITLTKQDEETIRTKNSETRERLDTKMKDMKDILQNSAAKNPLLSLLQKTKVDIGIFSRSDESDYSWLVELLRSADFSDRVRSVTPCYISNSGRQKFREDVSKCNLGILYHTKNRGRINVTDVAGALYDEELRDLSGKLGKDNVIVVIDDLKDSSDIEKKRILQSQRSIKNRGQGLFLISHDEKLLASAERKMTQLRAMITGGMVDMTHVY